MAKDDVPQFSIEGPRATIRFCRPAEHNRIDPEDLSVLLGHFQRTLADKSVRALVITGSGGKTFSSGYTISAIREQLDDRFENMLDTLESLPLPVICAVNGSVFGGATDLALACDFRIGIRGSRMLMPAAKFGLHYYPGGIRRYVTRLGLSAAKKLFLTAQTIEAEEMLRIGFLTELVESDQLDGTVTRYVDSIAVCEPVVVAAMKRHLNMTANGDVNLAALRADYDLSLRSPELARRLEKLEKR